MASSLKTSPANVEDGRLLNRCNERAEETAVGMYEKLGRTQNIVKFARQKDRQETARVKLLFFNNSKRKVEWSIRFSEDVIQAIPGVTGLITAFENNECTLIWQRPEGLKSWREKSAAEMVLHIKLLDVETGKVVGEANSKFRAVVDPEAICTADKPPIHKMILNSERTVRRKRKIKTKEKSNVLSKVQSQAVPKNVSSPRDTQMNYWLFVFLVCLLAALLLKVLTENREKDREN